MKLLKYISYGYVIGLACATIYVLFNVYLYGQMCFDEPNKIVILLEVLSVLIFVPLTIYYFLKGVK